METQESNSVTLNQRDRYHEILMINILKCLSDTPLVLKGGTALYLGYGLNRFSEDLDFDSSKKINLFNKIRLYAPHGFSIEDIGIKKDTDSVSRYIVKYKVEKINIRDALKIEISYRTPVPEIQTVVKNGIRFASPDRIIDNKLQAAYDGNNTRTKGRDLFDLHFLASRYPEYFNLDLATRLHEFAGDPDNLVSLYQDDIKEDPLLNEIMDVERIALEISDMASRIYEDRRLESLFCSSPTI